jgi:serine/threonine-protein kinase HipA
MKRTIEVHIGETPHRVGLLHYSQDGARESAVFEYDADWLRAPDRFAIDPSLPLQTGPQFHKKPRDGSVFHSVIADTEPDGWGRMVILRAQAKRRSAAKEIGETLPPIATGLDFLLEVDDPSRVGALRFRDEAGQFQRVVEHGRSAAPPLIELRHLTAATRAVEMNAETAADLEYLRGRGTSLGGLRPKCSIIDSVGRLSIGKFPSVTDERAVTKAEVLALHLATHAGVRAAEAKLVMSDETPVAVIRRFDRGKGGGRLMYASAATLLGVDTGAPGEHTYAEIVDAIRQFGAQAQPDIDELWRRIAFSISINNVDDHLHNHGFLHVESGKWRLSPAFDVNPFPERARELKTWITEETGPTSSVEALLSAAPYFALTPSRAREILAEVERAVARWRTVGREIGMSEVEVEQFADAFEHPERDAVRKTTAGPQGTPGASS